MRNLASGASRTRLPGGRRRQLPGERSGDARRTLLRIWVVNAAGGASPSQDVTVQGQVPVAQDPAAVAPALDASTTQTTLLAGQLLLGEAPPVQFGVQIGEP